MTMVQMVNGRGRVPEAWLRKPRRQKRTVDMGRPIRVGSSEARAIEPVPVAAEGRRGVASRSDRATGPKGRTIYRGDISDRINP